MYSCQGVNKTSNTEDRINGPNKIFFKQNEGTKSRGGEFGVWKTQHTVSTKVNVQELNDT